MTLGDGLGTKNQWGVIRHALGSGCLPEEDAVCLDGWYSSKDAAMAVARDWAKHFPGWFIAVVELHHVWAGGDFGQSELADKPLTGREEAFVTGKAPSKHLWSA